MSASLTKSQWLGLIALSLVALSALFIPQIWIGFGLGAVAIFIWWLSFHLDYGWYILVFLSPLIQWEWQLDFLFRWFPQYPWLYGAHAPVVEFWTVLTLIAFGIYLLRERYYGRGTPLRFPGLQWFALFVLSAAVSIINLPGLERSNGIKYLFHFILLFYFGYIVLGANIIESETMWRRSLKVLAVVGFLGAVMGLASLFLGVWQGDGFHRAVPFAIWGWMPFGDQHIFLAEVLTTTLPIYLYFWRYASTARAKRWLGAAAFFIFFIGLLTLSRAGWLTFGFEAAIFYYLTRHEGDWRVFAKTWWWVALVAVPILAYLGYFLLTSQFAQSSTAARLSLTEMSIYLFKQHPLIGQGVGSFPARVGEIQLFVLQFGSELDAHGIIQKLIAEQGIFGLVTFTIFIGWILYMIGRRYYDQNYTEEARSAYFVSLFLVLSPLIFQLFNTQFYSSKMWVPIALAMSQSIIYERHMVVAKLKSNLKIRRPRVITDL